MCSTGMRATESIGQGQCRCSPGASGSPAIGTPSRSTIPCSSSPITVTEVVSQPIAQRPMKIGSALRRTSVSAQLERKIDPELSGCGIEDAGERVRPASEGAEYREIRGDARSSGVAQWL